VHLLVGGFHFNAVQGVTAPLFCVFVVLPDVKIVRIIVRVVRTIDAIVNHGLDELGQPTGGGVELGQITALHHVRAGVWVRELTYV